MYSVEWIRTTDITDHESGGIIRYPTTLIRGVCRGNVTKTPAQFEVIELYDELQHVFSDGAGKTLKKPVPPTLDNF